MHSNARIKFDVIYWIIGILYLIFDLDNGIIDISYIYYSINFRIHL